MADTIPYLVDENDPELESGMVEYGSCTGYLSRPKGGASLGSVVVIHENVGLVDHIKDVARHFAKEGFAALAPDMLQRTGGTAQYQTSEDAIAAIRSLDPNGCVEDLTSALEHLKSQGFTNGKVGVVGYCWGGGQSLNFATKCNGNSTPPWCTTAATPIRWSRWPTSPARSWATTPKTTPTSCPASSP